MKLTSASVYALRALIHLARHEGDGLIASHTIAAAEGMPEGFLGKALEPLVPAGVLLSGKGPTGGYRLARPARSIPLLEVVEAVDGSVRGQAPGVGGPDGARLEAELQGVCDDAAEAVRGRLRRVTVADLAGEGE
jgi:Rrf2 family protein